MQLAALVDTGLVGVSEKIGKGPTRDYTLLHWAMRRNQPEMVRALLQRGADVAAATETDATPQTPLMVGRKYEAHEALAALSEHQAETTPKPAADACEHARAQCRFGNACRNVNCRFEHPPDWPLRGEPA